jgi:hypothetical protein
VFVELPEAGSTVSQGGKFGSVESVKAVSDVLSPISGTVTETNNNLGDAPETVSHDQSSFCLFPHICIFYVIFPSDFLSGLDFSMDSCYEMKN